MPGKRRSGVGRIGFRDLQRRIGIARNRHLRRWRHDGRRPECGLGRGIVGHKSRSPARADAVQIGLCDRIDRSAGGGFADQQFVIRRVTCDGAGNPVIIDENIIGQGRGRAARARVRDGIGIGDLVANGGKGADIRDFGDAQRWIGTDRDGFRHGRAVYRDAAGRRHIGHAAQLHILDLDHIRPGAGQAGTRGQITGRAHHAGDQVISDSHRPDHGHIACVLNRITVAGRLAGRKAVVGQAQERLDHGQFRGLHRKGRGAGGGWGDDRISVKHGRGSGRVHKAARIQIGLCRGPARLAYCRVVGGERGCGADQGRGNIGVADDDIGGGGHVAGVAHCKLESDQIGGRIIGRRRSGLDPFGNRQGRQLGGIDRDSVIGRCHIGHTPGVGG